MKKILTVIAGLVAGSALLHAQGYIIIQSTASAIHTNTSSYYAQGAGTSGNTSASTVAPNAYYYQLLFATSTNAADLSPLGADWSVATIFGGGTLLASNYLIAGSITGPGTSGGVQVNMAAATTYYAMLVGWSSNLGNSWSTVSAELNSGNWNANGYFGNTTIGTMTPFATAGAGDPSLFPATWGNGTMSLYAVTAPVPEPTTMALAGLGGLSLLLFRRRK